MKALKLSVAILALSTGMALAENPMVGGAAMYEDKNIVENAVNSADHTTLVAAVQAAGLVETLQGEGPFTVFAPTNEAFAKLPAGTVETLLKPENKDQLVKILTCHVVPGAVTSDQLAGQRMDVATVQGQTVHIDGRSGVKVNKSRVTTADIMASNGVIHVIDKVLLPK